MGDKIYLPVKFNYYDKGILNTKTGEVFEFSSKISYHDIRIFAKILNEIVE